MIGLVLFGAVLASSAHGHNVSAVGKPVSSSSVVPDHGPELAVDNDLRSDLTHVFHNSYTEPTEAWFSLNLEEEVISPDVTIYFRTDYKAKRNGVRISLSNVAVSTTDFCHTVTGDADGSDIADVYSFVCDSVGQFLTISTVTLNDGYGIVLNLAEVQVHACSKFTYGPTCDSECHCVDEPCDWRLENPVCSLGCLPGWQSSSCGEFAFNVPFFKPCDTVVTFTLQSVPQMILTEMKVLSEETRACCMEKCTHLFLCTAAEFSASTCTLWRTGSSGPSQSRDMWKKMA